MKNLGKIFVLISFLHVILFANVKIFVDKTQVEQGDEVTLRIEASGEDITPPSIDSLCGVDILSTSSQQSIRIINGDISKSYNFIYTFEPEKSCEINPIPISVDGQIQRTKKIKIKVVSNPASSKDKDFILELKSNKKEVFIGETFNVKLIFKQKKDADAIDSKFYPPKLDGFWIKYQSPPKKYEDKKYIITEIDYKMAAQREGNLEITPAKIKIAQREIKRDYWSSFSPSIKWKSYYSNSLKMKVFAPPKGLELVGDFDISVKVDKTKIHPNQPVSAVVTIKGDGNIEDIETFKPFVQDANVFEEKPKINQKDSIFTQKITFVSDKSFKIPPFKIRYFDPKTKKIEQKWTQPIDIIVEGNVASKDEGVVIKKASSDFVASPKDKEISIEVSYAITWAILSFIAGLFMGAVSVYFFFNKAKLKKAKKFSYKDKKALFVKLLPYKEHKDVKNFLNKLEKSLYEDGNIVIDSKEVKEIIQKYNII